MGQRGRRILVVFVVLVLVITAFQVNFSNLDGRGQVLDYASRKPIPGAVLILQCYDQNLIHGSTMIRTVQETSAANGAYRFSFSDTWDCDHLSVHAKRDGYVDAEDAQLPATMILSTGAHVPKGVLMVNLRDQVRLQLEGFLRESQGVIYPGPGATDLAEYTKVARPYMRSRGIASSDEHLAWIRDHYCDKLIRNYARLSSAEIARLSTYSEVKSYATDVEPFCVAAETVRQ